MATTADAPATPDPATAALLDALRALLLPLARLALARGLPFQATEELLKQAFVTAAAEAPADGPPHRQVSRISTSTGINRREVTRLLQTDAAAPPPARSLAIEVFARWVGDPGSRDADGVLLPRARAGPPPSFEALARSVTTDVHPRSLLDELTRLGLAAQGDSGDTVRLLEEAFVPRGDQARMLGLLGANVGDHLAAAVSNVAGDAQAHFEQAIAADELSAQSVADARAMISRQWRVLFAALVPELERLIADDRAAGRRQDHRLRVGLYEFNQAAAAADPNAAAPAATRQRRPRRKKE